MFGLLFNLILLLADYLSYLLFAFYFFYLLNKNNAKQISTEEFERSLYFFCFFYALPYLSNLVLFGFLDSLFVLARFALTLPLVSSKIPTETVNGVLSKALDAIKAQVGQIEEKLRGVSAK